MRNAVRRSGTWTGVPVLVDAGRVTVKDSIGRVRRLLAAAVVGVGIVASAGCGAHSLLILHGVVASAGAGSAAQTRSTDAAAVVLAGLPVQDAAPRAGYDREQFGPAWSDDLWVPSGRNGCDQRSDVLRRDLREITLKPDSQGCVPLAGVLVDPYTGITIGFQRGPGTSTAVHIDHVVALSNAWQTGAQQLTDDQRRDLAGDPLNLLAVDSRTNQAKGDGDAAAWLPPNHTVWCDYVARQIAVKSQYALWVTRPERDAMRQVLAGCPDHRLPSAIAVAVPTPVRM